MEDPEKYPRLTGTVTSSSSTTVFNTNPVMLSKTVSYNEATKSATAIKFGIDNTPNEEQLEDMKRLSEKGIDSIRNQFGRVDINSFFRCPQLNRKISKSKTSQHMKGQAVDLDTPNDEQNLAIFNFIKDNLVFDQLLLEHPKADGTPSWVHFSLKFKDNRGQVLVVLNDKTIPFGVYTVGMV